MVRQHGRVVQDDGTVGAAAGDHRLQPGHRPGPLAAGEHDHDQSPTRPHSCAGHRRSTAPHRRGTARHPGASARRRDRPVARTRGRGDLTCKPDPGHDQSGDRQQEAEPAAEREVRADPIGAVVGAEQPVTEAEPQQVEDRRRHGHKATDLDNHGAPVRPGHGVRDHVRRSGDDGHQKAAHQQRGPQLAAPIPGLKQIQERLGVPHCVRSGPEGERDPRQQEVETDGARGDESHDGQQAGRVAPGGLRSIGGDRGPRRTVGLPARRPVRPRQQPGRNRRGRVTLRRRRRLRRGWEAWLGRWWSRRRPGLRGQDRGSGGRRVHPAGTVLAVAHRFSCRLPIDAFQL